MGTEITIIAEKPSVARSIAEIVKANKKEDGYLSGNGYYVTWAFGHLIGLSSPEAYGFSTKWIKDDLPMIPNEFQIQPLEGKEKKTSALYKKQLKIIAELFRKSRKIIVATDAGREGELIFRYIYNYLKIKYKINTPFVRLWISSLTDKAIIEGLKNLKPGEEYDNIYNAGQARSEADWLIGLNGTRAITLNVNDRTVWSVGRVQTPTLAMICKRFLDNKNFISTPYFMLQGCSHKGNINFQGIHDTRFSTKQDCELVKQIIEQHSDFTVIKVEKKIVYAMPPLLYDLTTIQKEANSKFSFSAEMTLNLCQSLYEKKLITYPRTGSRYIPQDVYEMLPLLIKNATSHPRFSHLLSFIKSNPIGTISVNDKKVTDHHALLPTENIPKNEDINENEKKIYELIVGRMLESISPKEEKEITTATLIPGNLKEYSFIVKGISVLKTGWREVMLYKENEKEKEENSNGILPLLKENEKIPIDSINLQEKMTKAPPLLTENSLLSLMETAGKELDNEEEREALKDIGIGTPATRAEIIERLLSIKYISRIKKNLIPTEKGLSLYEVVKNMGIANVSMTGKWENALNKIAEGKIPVERFNQEIRIYTEKIVKELLNFNLINVKNINSSQFKCPKCGNPLIIYDKVCKCSNNNGNCNFFFWRIVFQRKLTEKDISDILKNGETKNKVKLKNKEGKNFEAKLRLENDGRFSLIW